MSIYLFNVSIIHFFSFINIVNSIQNILVEKTLFSQQNTKFSISSLLLFSPIFIV